MKTYNVHHIGAPSKRRPYEVHTPALAAEGYLADVLTGYRVTRPGGSTACAFDGVFHCFAATPLTGDAEPVLIIVKES